MTTAATTGFAVERVELGGGYHVFLDGNQKITAGNGEFDEPVANAFSLPQVVTCPRRTPTCERTCYVHNLETAQGWLHDHYKHNLATIRRLVDSPSTWLAGHTAITLANWIDKNARGGFRWHVSGDLFSKQYAAWVGFVARMSSTPQWIYTRSFHLLDALGEADNLTVNLSADRNNYWLARRVSDERGGLRVCYLLESLDEDELDNLRDLREGDVIFPDYSLRGVGMKPHAFRQGSPLWQRLTGDQRRMVCPVDAYGKSENNRCGPCRRCLDG